MNCYRPLELFLAFIKVRQVQVKFKSHLFSMSILNPIPNQLGHMTYNERADSAITW